MKQFRSVRPEEADPFFQRIGKDWMLLTVADGEGANTMTVSWGCIGVLWNKPVAICYIRPQRYTYGLAEQATHLTLSNCPESYRDVLAFCGRASGRDCDKFKETGLTCAHTSNGVPYPEQASTVLVCRKLYADDLRKSAFLEADLIPKCYPSEDFHRFYICEIEEVLVAD